MKPSITLVSTIFLACLIPATAEEKRHEKGTEKTIETTQNADGSVTRTETTFTPDSRGKIEKFFDSFKTHRHGLPPGWEGKIRVKDMPMAWRSERIKPGLVIQGNEREYLVAAPPELIKVLPEPTTGVRYYVAGSNVIAVDSNYRVVDSVQIPSIQFTDEKD